jgi:PKD repeat protein
MKKFTFLTLIVLSTLFGTAQKWVDMMHDPNANFYDVVAEFNSYWKNKPYERGQGYKAFRRWEWFMAPRVYPTGDKKLASRSYALEKYQEYLDQNITAKTMASAAVSATTANWTALGPFGSPVGGDAGRIQVIKLKPGTPTTIYVGTAAGGLWTSTDNGVNYTTNTDQFASLGIADICINPTNTAVMYVATGDKDAGDTYATGVLKSTNGGATWSALTGLTWTASQQRRIYRMLMHPTNPDIILVFSTAGVYRTTNGGTSWTQTSTTSMVDAEFKTDDPNTIFGVTLNGVRKSIDNGLTFSTITVSGLSANRLSVAVSAANPNCVYVLASAPSNGFGGLYRSTNAGTTYSLMSSTPNIFDWNTVPSGTSGQGWYDIAIDASPTNSNEIIAGGVNSWKSTNGGVNWTINSHWYGGGAPYVHADLHYVYYVSGTTCFLGHDGGISRTTNSGASWQTINGQMNIAQIYKLGNAANTATKVVSGHQDNGTNLMSGTAWNQIYGGDGMDCFISWAGTNTIVASYVEGDFQRSTNGGGSFANIVSGLTGSAQWVAPIIQHPTQQNTYFCGYQHVFKTTNQGTSWTQLGSIGTTLDEVRISPSNTLIMYATSPGSVWKTINGGTSWSSISAGLPGGSITDLTLDNQNPNNIYVTFSGYSATNKVYQSTNGGATWTNYSTGLPPIPINCAIYTNNSAAQAVYVGTDIGVYYREASMTSWIPYFTGLPNVVVNELEIYYPTSKIRAATYGRGVWESDLYSNGLSAPTAAFNTAVSPGCVNTPLVFSDQSSNAPTSWAWSFPGGSPASSTAQNPNVSYATAGTYTVNLASTNGNGSSPVYTSTILITSGVTAAPINASVCTGQFGSIGVSGNATSVNWSNGQIGNSISVSNAGTTAYNYTASLGACTTLGTATLFVNVSPVTPTIVVNGTNLSTTVTAGSYQWYLNGSPIAGANSATYVVSQDGYYSVWASNGSCVTSSAPEQILLTGLSNAVSTLSGLTVGPNPVKDLLNIAFNKYEKTVTFEIVNALGQQIKKGNISAKDSQKYLLDVSILGAGVYTLKLRSDSEDASYKFIKSN